MGTTYEQFRKFLRKGAWLAQSEKHATLDFGVVSLSHTLDVEITKQNKNLKKMLAFIKKKKKNPQNLFDSQHNLNLRVTKEEWR